MLGIKSKYHSDPSVGNNENQETRLYHEENDKFFMWFITALKIIPKQDYQKCFARWPQACSISRMTNLKRFPTIHLLVDYLGHDFLKQSLTILLTYLFPSSFSNFSQFPLPLSLLQRNPRHQIMPSTQIGAGGELFYF